MSEIDNTQTAAQDTALAVYQKITEHLQSVHSDEIRVTQNTFNFRTTKVKDEVTGEESPYKRPSVTLPLYAPSAKKVQMIAAEGGEEMNLILSCLDDAVYTRAYEILSQNPGMTIMDFPIEKLSWKEMSAYAAQQGVSRGLNREELKLMVEDFRLVMPSILPEKPVEYIEAIAGILRLAFKPLQASPDKLEKLRPYLNAYITQAPNAETYSGTLEWLKNKLDEMIASSNSVFAFD